MKTVKGDLVQLALDGEFDVIVHGCNCFCTMGAGIAKTIKQHFPAAYKADCETRSGDKTKLGTYSLAHCTIPYEKLITIINAYTQFDYGKRQVNVDYGAVRSVFHKLSNSFGTNSRIGIPRIGCGLAKGDWKIVKQIVEQEMPKHNVTVVEYVPRG